MIPDRAAIRDRQELQAQIGRHQYSGHMIKDGRMRGTIAVIARRNLPANFSRFFIVGHHSAVTSGSPGMNDDQTILHEWRSRKSPLRRLATCIDLKIFRPANFARKWIEAQNIPIRPQREEPLVTDRRSRTRASSGNRFPKATGVFMCPQDLARLRIQTNDCLIVASLFLSKQPLARNGK